MIRPIRLKFSGDLNLVTSIRNERKPIYLDQSDMAIFLDTLNDVCCLSHWIIHAYRLMPYHYHVVLKTPNVNQVRGIRQLIRIYTQQNNLSMGLLIICQWIEAVDLNT